MVRNFFALGIFLSSSLVNPAFGGQVPQSLYDCFRAALKRSETVAIQGELITQAEEKHSQARAALLPGLGGSLTYLRQATPTETAAANSSPAEQTTVKLTATQPLFKGLREYAAIRQADRQKDAAAETEMQAKIQLYTDVATGFYGVLSSEKDLSGLATEIEVNQKRHEELLGFRKIGRSRNSEVLQLESNIAVLESQREVIQGQIRAAREVFAFLTGLDRDVPLSDAESVPDPLPTLESFLSLIDERPDVKAAAKALEASEEGVSIAKGGHLPSLDLLGDYYFKRPGTLSSVKWDVQLSLTVPLFSGGTVLSQTRVASSQVKAGELALNRTRRVAEQEIRTLYSSLQSDKAQILALGKATHLSFENFRAELHDYRLGLVTNLEVLQTITSSQETQRALDRAKFSAKADFAKLEAAVGRRPRMAQEEK